MSLTQIKHHSRKFSVQMVAGFCLIFVVSTAAIFFLVYGLFSNSLSKRDHGIIEAKANEYVTIYQKAGLDALRTAISHDKMLDMLTRVEDMAGKTILFHAPDNFDESDKSIVIKKLTLDKEDWDKVVGKSDDTTFEVLSLSLDADHRLQIGRSVDDKEDLLERLMNIFLFGFVMTVGIGSAAGILFTNRALSPIRDLIATIGAIHAGDIEARVPHRKANDELESLVELFNKMLNQIQTLIHGMRETLDNVSHELKTPITRLRASAELALSGPESVEKYREALGACLEQTSEIISMLNLLMDISEADAGAIKLNRERFQAGLLIAEVIDLYELIAEDKQIDLSVSCSKDVFVEGDRLRIKRVLANLVDNAIKYSESNGTVLIFAFRTQHGTLIGVKDRGKGMKPEDIPKIWNRLYRGDQSRSSPGLGLGLSFVKSIVTAHGGSVDVESEMGQGSTISFEIPYVTAATMPSKREPQG